MEQLHAPKKQTKRVYIGIPMTGLLRSEWHLSYVGQVIPTNWSQGTGPYLLDHDSPMDFLVADARNVVATRAIKEDYEWLLFIDHDVCLQPNTLLVMNDYMRKGDIPIVGGLYFTRSLPAEPLVYRGYGNSFYTDWKIGDKVWLTGMGLGCTLINVKLLKAVAEDSEVYKVESKANGVTKDHEIWKIFETPAESFIDPETGNFRTYTGTEDLAFYNRLKNGGYYKKAGFGNIQRKKYPLLCDTRLFCTHIDFNGVRYPSAGEEKDYMRN